jgi:hypothetical protein
MRHPRWSCCLVVAQLLIGGQVGAQGRGPSLAASHAAAIVDSVQSFMAGFQRHYAAARWDSVAALYSGDARFRWVESGVVVARSAREIGQYLDQMPPGMKLATTYSEMEIFALAPGMAQIVTSFKSVMGDPAAGGASWGGSSR